MTDFATWWRKANGRSGLWALVPLWLAGCAAAPTVEAPPPPAPPRPAAPVAASGAVPAGLTPLPTSQQVVAAFPVGRKDHFGTLVPQLVPGATAATAGGRAAASLPPPAFLQDIRVTGVISSGGQSEAVVTYKELSGTLRRGDRGGRTTDLLPAGWSVAAVDVAKGQLILQSGSRKVKVDL